MIILLQLAPILPVPSDLDRSSYNLPLVPKESLYKCDPTRYKPRSNKMYTQQEDVEASLAAVNDLMVSTVKSHQSHFMYLSGPLAFC